MQPDNPDKSSNIYEPAAKPELDPHHVHEQLMISAPKRVSFEKRFGPRASAPESPASAKADPQAFKQWQDELQAALTGCLGKRPPQVDAEPVWGDIEERDGFNVRPVEFAVEPHQHALGWLVTPQSPGEPRLAEAASVEQGRVKEAPQEPGTGELDRVQQGAEAPDLPERRPTVICLQGHSPGAHISLGEARFPGDEESIAEDRDYAVQAVRRGYNAFVLEQRAFGQRMDSRPPEARHHYDYANVFTDERCRHQAMVALLLGRTLVGERVHDVRCAVDILTERPEVDPKRIAVMGNSGGGTVSLYAACVEPRIAAVMPSCSFCPYLDSIGRIDHCSDNYLPGALLHFDIPDLAGLIAPRPMVVVAGEVDPIFPYPAIERGVALARRVYGAAGAPEAVGMFTGPGGHRFYAGAWETFEQVTGWE